MAQVKPCGEHDRQAVFDAALALLNANKRTILISDSAEAELIELCLLVAGFHSPAPQPNRDSM